MIGIKKPVFSWLLTPVPFCESCPDNVQRSYSCSAMVFFLPQNCRCMCRYLGNGVLSRSVSGFISRGITISNQMQKLHSWYARGQSPNAQRSLKLSKLQGVQNMIAALLLSWCVSAFLLGPLHPRYYNFSFKRGLVSKIYHRSDSAEIVYMIFFVCFNSSKNTHMKTEKRGLVGHYWAHVSWDVEINLFVGKIILKM